MNIPGMGLLTKLQDKGNQIKVPMARNLGAVDLLQQTFKESNEDHVAAFAGNLAYSGLFSLFPFLVFLLSLLGIFHATSLVSNLLTRARVALPAQAVDLIDGPILQITQQKASGGFAISAIFSVLLALWAVSGAFRSVMDALNVMYGVEDHRSLVKRVLVSVMLAVVSALLFVTAAVLAVAGPAIARAIAGVVGFGSVFKWTWYILQWPVLAVIVLLAFALVYYFAPDVEQKFKFITPGSIIALVAWLLFSLGFSLYVNNFSTYNASYGALAGVVIMLLYMYFSSYIMLLGAEMNQVIEKHNPEGKNEGERNPEDREEPSTAQKVTKSATATG